MFLYIGTGWLEIFSPFSYQLEHRTGKLHSNADGLS